LSREWVEVLTEDLLPVFFGKPPAKDPIETTLVWTSFYHRFIYDHFTHLQSLDVTFQKKNSISTGE
jgi:hypothetical protein